MLYVYYTICIYSTVIYTFILTVRLYNFFLLQILAVEDDSLCDFEVQFYIYFNTTLSWINIIMAAVGQMY